MVKSASSNLEQAFEFYWRAFASGLGLHPEREYRFAPPRRWRFDFAWPAAKVALECEGGTWNRGRHVRGNGFRKDCEKYNAAVAGGWRVFRVTADMMTDDPWGLCKMIGRTLLGKDNKDND